MNTALAAALTAGFAASSRLPLEASALASLPNPQSSPRAASSVEVTRLMREPLVAMPNPEVTVITLTVAPNSVSPPHQHTGPVFAYVLAGEIENQVDPNPPRTYRAGDYFYEPPMHTHRMLRNLSPTQPAKLLIFEVGEKGKPFTIPAH